MNYFAVIVEFDVLKALLFTFADGKYYYLTLRLIWLFVVLPSEHFMKCFHAYPCEMYLEKLF